MEELPNNGVAVDVPPVRLEVRKNGPVWELLPKVPGGNLLRSLAQVGHPEVADLALKIIFEYGDTCDAVEDAIAAYTLKPLESPPGEYIIEVHRTDWSRSPDTDRAVVLAGLTIESERLLKIIELTERILDDGSALLAASASDDKRFMLALARVAMYSDWHEIAPPQQYSVLTSFRRWLERGLIDHEEVQKLVKPFAWSQEDDGRDERFIRYLFMCRWS